MVWEAFQETIRARVIVSQKLSRDSGETIFAARHQGVVQGPLGGTSAKTTLWKPPFCEPLTL